MMKRRMMKRRSVVWRSDRGRVVPARRGTKSPPEEPRGRRPERRSNTERKIKVNFSQRGVFVSLTSFYLQQESLVLHVPSPRHHVQFGDHGMSSGKRGDVGAGSPRSQRQETLRMKR